MMGSANCTKDEVFDGIGCEKCSDYSSPAVIAFTLLLTLFAGWYVDKIFASRQRMIRLKVMSTFFQTAELTAAIRIKWPQWTTWMPFSIPVFDAKCAAALLGFESANVLTFFYMFIYIPLAIFGGLVYFIRNARVDSRQEVRVWGRIGGSEEGRRGGGD